MSEFLYCLNTSTIRPTPLLEKIRIAGKAGYTAIEPWNDEITAYLEQGGSLAELKRALADAGLQGRQRDRAARLDHGRGGRACARPRRMPAADGPGGRAGEPLHRRQPAAGSGRPGPGHRAIRRTARRSARRSASSRRWNSSGSSTGSRTSRAPGRSPRGPAIPRRDGRRRRLPHDPRRRLGRRPAHAPGRPARLLPHQRRARRSPTRSPRRTRTG